MAIFLVQHGQCLSKDEDPQKGLSDQGAADVKRIAQVAAGYEVQVKRIVHSGKKRALQTAEILAAHLKPGQGISSVGGMNPLDDAAAFAATLDISSDCMVVGHLPHLEKLAACLVTGQGDIPIFQLQNGGILCLDYYRDTQQVVIKWGLMPHVG